MIFRNTSGDKRAAVYTLQEWLRAVNRAGAPIPQIVPDGEYGEATAAAIRVFQGLRKLPQTGITDYATWTELKKAYEDAEKKLSPSAGVFPFDCMAAGGKLCAGDSSPLVCIVQALLDELSASYDLPAECEMNGVLDDGTAKNITALQKLWGLPATGEVDRETWNMMADCFNARVPIE